MADKLTADEIEQHTGYRMPHHNTQLLLAFIAGREESAAAELEQENRLIRARNERLEKENAQLRQHLQVLRTGIEKAKEHLNDYYRHVNAGRHRAASSSVADAEFLITKAYVQTNEGERNG